MSEEKLVFCQNCGKQIPEDAKFCSFCGARQELKDTPKANLTDDNKSVAEQSNGTTGNNAITSEEMDQTKETVVFVPTGTQASETQTNVELVGATSSTFGGAIKRYFNNMFTTAGRTSLADYWWTRLFMFLIEFGIGIVLAVVFVGPMIASYNNSYYGYGSDDAWTSFMFGSIGFVLFALLLGVIVFIMDFCITVRRLHDSNKSGLFMLFYLLNLIPYLGTMASGIVMLVFMLLPGTDGPNQFGAKTKTTTPKPVTHG